MKATELRLGNWVEPWSGGYSQITSIDSIEASIYPDPEDTEHFLFKRRGDIKGIKLTDAVMIKMGFRKLLEFETQIEAQYKIGDIIVNFNNGRYVIMCGTYELAQLNYVHELQNWYFLLAGKELRFKLRLINNARK